jgi:hypothetical protein
MSCKTRLQNIPPDKRDAFTQKLLSSVKESAAIFHSDNYYAQYETAVRLLEDPNHSKRKCGLRTL